MRLRGTSAFGRRAHRALYFVYIKYCILCFVFRTCGPDGSGPERGECIDHRWPPRVCLIKLNILPRFYGFCTAHGFKNNAIGRNYRAPVRATHGRVFIFIRVWRTVVVVVEARACGAVRNGYAPNDPLCQRRKSRVFPDNAARSGPAPDRGGRAKRRGDRRLCGHARREGGGGCSRGCSPEARPSPRCVCW